jgi:hypothetical protein
VRFRSREKSEISNEYVYAQDILKDIKQIMLSQTNDDSLTQLSAFMQPAPSTVVEDESFSLQSLKKPEYQEPNDLVDEEVASEAQNVPEETQPNDLPQPNEHVTEPQEESIIESKPPKDESFQKIDAILESDVSETDIEHLLSDNEGMKAFLQDLRRRSMAMQRISMMVAKLETTPASNEDKKKNEITSR